MKKKDINYKLAKQQLYNKDVFINNYIEDMLIKCNQMFHYENLPDTIPKRILEQFLMEGGFCIFTKVNDRYVILQGGLGGELDEYYQYTECIVANPFLKLYKTFKLNEDCVLIRNDCRMKGLLPILSKYAFLCNDSEMSLNMITKTLRCQFFLSAGDNKTKENADVFMQKLENGELSCIAENTFLEGVKVHLTQNAGNFIQQFTELNQYFRATAFNEIGLDANYNMKRERLNMNEVDLNTSILIPLADDMLEQRKQAVEKINEKYGLNIKVELSSVWKMQKESVDNATQQQETETEEEKETETKDETETETKDETETETEEKTEEETAKEKEQKENE